MGTLRHLQLVILEIAKDIDKLCRDNNIKYIILGGSAIGAIRHKGFIPWDDDFDIIMDNKNYSRFCQVCREKLNKELAFFCLDFSFIYGQNLNKRTNRLAFFDSFASNELILIFTDTNKIN